MPRDYISRKQTPEWRKNYDAVYPRESLGLTRERWLNEGDPDETYSEWLDRKGHEEKFLRVANQAARALLGGGGEDRDRPTESRSACLHELTDDADADQALGIHQHAIRGQQHPAADQARYDAACEAWLGKLR